MAASVPRSRSPWKVGLLVVALLAAGGAIAQASGALPWKSLTPAQRLALAPLERDWARIDGPRQEKWLEVANRFPRLPPEEQQRLQQRMVEWARLTPQQRGQARLNFREAHDLGADERQARWEAYQALPADQKRRLAERGEAPRAPAPAPRNRADASAKRNVVTVPPSAGTRTVAPTMIQAPPGASTRLLSRPNAPPLHQQAGLPKITATPGFVDAATLLPQRGAQGAAAEPRPAGKRPDPGKPNRPD